MKPDPSIRLLDPLGDPPSTPPDGESLLRRLVVEPVPRAAAGSRRRRRLSPLPGAAAAIAAAAAAIVLVTPADDEQEVPAGAPGSGAPVVHYVVRETREGVTDSTGTTEVWRLDDGSRARIVTRYGDITTEEAVTESERLTFLPEGSPRPGGPTIIRYRAGDDFGFIDDPEFVPPEFGAPPIVQGEVGDPRSLPLRADRGDDGVTPLGAATVRDTAVRQFRVGECRKPKRTRAGSAPVVAEYAVVSLARDTGYPVRVVIRSCSPDDPLGQDRTLDFTTFEELPATRENLARLELSPHPGARVVDGVEIDRQEERDESARAPRPTPTPPTTPPPTPTP